MPSTSGIPRLPQRAVSQGQGGGFQHKVAVLGSYAQTEAMEANLSLPENPTPESLAEFLASAGELYFLPGDPNLDNLKRNIAIQVFLEFDMAEILTFGKQWLNRWSQNKHAPWHQEWVEIINRADNLELTDILLSHEQDRVRQRLSMPFAEMLDFSTILQIKRKCRHEKV